MAHFSKLGVGNIVEQVVVVHNNVAPTVNPVTAIKEPIQLPNINPEVNTIGIPKPSINTQIIVNRKKK